MSASNVSALPFSSLMYRSGSRCSFSPVSATHFALEKLCALRKVSSLVAPGMIRDLWYSPITQRDSVLSCALGKFPGFQHPRGHLQLGAATPTGQGSCFSALKACQVKSDDSEGGTLSSESVILDEQILERDLQIAIEEENYARAAKIRDSLRFLHEDGKASILAANARFYNSFTNGDLGAMQALWAKGEHVCCVHPGVSGIYGYDLVLGSWEFVWAEYEFPLQIELKDMQVHVRGDLGYVMCVELVKTNGSSWGKQFATNVFERIDGQWFICIHHASHVDL